MKKSKSGEQLSFLNTPFLNQLITDNSVLNTANLWGWAFNDVNAAHSLLEMWINIKNKLNFFLI